jgi:hypothetical protein
MCTSVDSLSDGVELAALRGRSRSSSSGWPVSIKVTSPPLPATGVFRYDIQIGSCQRSRRRVWPRHPRQTSQAFGVAGVQVGPRVVLAMGWCAREIDAIRQRRTPVVPGERGVTAQQTNWRHGMANKDTGYGRNWKKWLAIYVVAGVIVYLIVYLVFFSGGGGGAAGGGGLY